MQKIETPDGFSKAAESMRSLAATTDDQTEKDAILSVAKKFEDTHLRAFHVFAEVNESIDQANKLAKGLTRERFTHRTWEFWLVLVVVLNFLCYAKCSV